MNMTSGRWGPSWPASPGGQKHTSRPSQRLVAVMKRGKSISWKCLLLLKRQSAGKISCLSESGSREASMGQDNRSKWS